MQLLLVLKLTSCVKVAVVPGCTFAHIWRVTLELVESELSLVTLW